MIVTYGQMKDEQFARTLAKLSSWTGYKSTKIAYQVAKLGRRLNAEFKILAELHLKLVKKYAFLEEDGSISPVEGRPNTFKIRPEVEEEWRKALEEFYSTEVSLDVYPIPLEELEGVGLSPLELDSIDSILKYPLEVVAE